METKKHLFLLGAIIFVYNANVVELVDSIYPKSIEIPKTAFTCDNKPGDGFYADIETHCQSFHMCQRGKFESFTCPVGTVFSQNGRVCDFIYNVDCSTTPTYYNQPISEDVEIVETVVGFQTVHEDGYVIPPNPDEDLLLNVTSEQPEETLSTTETTVSIKTEESEVEIPLIPVKIQEGETVKEPMEPEKQIPLMVVKPRDDQLVKEPEGQIPVIPLIQSVIEPKPRDEQLVKEPEGQIPVIPLIQPVIESKPVMSILSVPEKKPTPAVVSIPSLPDQKVPKTEISKIPVSEETTTEIITPQLPFKEEPLIPQGLTPYSFHGKIPEPIVEDMNIINSMRDDKVTYPINDDKPFFDPINPNAHQINFPVSDMPPKPREKFETMSSVPFFLPNQVIFPMKPLQPVSNVFQIPQPHMSYVTPSNNLPERVKAVVNGLIHATHSFANHRHDHSSLHQNHLHFQPIVYQYGNQFRVVKPIVIQKPYVIKVPSVLLS